MPPPPGTGEPRPVRVAWWLGRGPDPDAVRELFVEPFNAGQADVAVELTVLTEAARDRTVQALREGGGPDLAMVPRAGDFVSLARSGRLLDLRRHAARLGWHDRLLAPALRLATVGDGLFGLPRSSETQLLLGHRAVLDELGLPLPTSSAALEAVAARSLAAGLTPFSAGCADLPESSELLWTLVLNHHAGPPAVRQALLGDRPWSSAVFVDALEVLVSWFDRGWFGSSYFERSIDDGLAGLVAGRAAMAPAMTGMLPAAGADVIASPFPVLRPGLAGPVHVLGTASLLGVNAATGVPDAAVRVLDAVFTRDVRRAFTARIPGDWNLPLVDDDAAALRQLAPATFAEPAVALAAAVRDGRHGYASWSYLPPRSEAVVTDQLRAVVEGRLSVRAHLADLDATFREERTARLVPGLAGPQA